MDHQEFSVDSPEYDAAWQLRRRVLLDPYGIDHERARTDDSKSIHLGLFDGAICIACLFLVPRTHGIVQMRQVAVAPERQRQGLGRQLVLGSESLAQERSFHLMKAHARVHALPVYRALEYEEFGETFQQVGIPHRLVQKVLSNRD